MQWVLIIVLFGDYQTIREIEHTCILIIYHKSICPFDELLSKSVSNEITIN